MDKITRGLQNSDWKMRFFFENFLFLLYHPLLRTYHLCFLRNWHLVNFLVSNPISEAHGIFVFWQKGTLNCTCLAVLEEFQPGMSLNFWCAMMMYNNDVQWSPAYVLLFFVLFAATSFFLSVSRLHRREMEEIFQVQPILCCEKCN